MSDLPCDNDNFLISLGNLECLRGGDAYQNDYKVNDSEEVTSNSLILEEFSGGIMNWRVHA